MKITTFALAAASPLLLIVTAAVRMPRIDPPVDRRMSIEASLDVPPRVRAFLRRSCYDCHSLETRWPWYARLPGVSHLILSDVKGGRAVVNFSEWESTAGKTPAAASVMLAAACESVRQGLMPKRPYPLMHPGAEPTRSDVEMFCAWTREQSAALDRKAGIHK